ncbi:hypothetical protein [Burkholderia sp. LMG 32019]|uniref:hypothetical protein n=1 Tax=Burkholderia sp. LMG 32019 TaxID=3158173 RepID=UPI003C2FCC68
MQFWTPEQAISLSLHIDPDQPVPKHLRTSFAERLRELQGAIEQRNSHLTVWLGKVERSTFVFWASQCEDHEDWKIPRESSLYKIAADEPIQDQGERLSAQHTAEIHENRYRAVGEYAQSASFDVAELDAWAVANRVPGSFRTLLTPDSVGADLPSFRRFQPCSSLLVLIASAFVPAEVEPHEAREKLLEAGDTSEYPNAVSRLRDLIMGRYERLLLNAVFDDELNLYDTLTYTKIDVTAARLRYEANPGAYVQAAQEPDMDSTQDSDANACPEKFTLYWLNTKLDEDASFAEQALAVLRRMNKRKPEVLRETITKASAASALVNEWLVNRDLPCYRRGRAIEDFAAEAVEPATGNLSEAMEILEDSIELHRDDVVNLLRQEGIVVPPYLLCEAPDGHTAQTPTHVADDAPGTKSVIAWRVAAENQLDKLIAAHGGIYPGHKVALRWFKANDAEAAFVPGGKDDEFTWVKVNGKRVTSALKTFQNGMADILKSRKIPD